jgi:hypothetical protein
MHIYTSSHAVNARLYEIAAITSDALDPDFDLAGEELDREFQELRIQLAQFE